MKFKPEFIERVQEATNLVDIISQYTQLKPAAGGFMGRCPFPDHPEKTPSFSVSEAKQVYHCFGCHKKGNVFTFLQEMRGMNFREAIEWLADRAQISLPEVSPEENEKLDEWTKRKKEILHANRYAAQYFQQQFRALPNSHPAVHYATKKRGLSDDVIKEFQIGYATEEWDGLAKFLEGKGVSMAVAEEAKLVKPRKEGKSGHYDFFRDRLMFPVLNIMNEVVAFGGRIIKEGEPKYLNSQESAVFFKGKVLYGLSSTARFIRSEDAVLVVEGYMDLVSLFQSGVTNAAASMGTALTADHAKLLSRMTKNIVVLFDGDAAGIQAAERSLPILLASGLHPKGLILPDGQDPDDFVRQHGAQPLQEKVQKASDLFSMVLSLWMQDFRGEASEKIQLADKLKPIFASIQDARLVQLYLSETAPKMKVDVPWLSQAVGRGMTRNTEWTPANPAHRRPATGFSANSPTRVGDRTQGSEPRTAPTSLEKEEKISENNSENALIALKGITFSERTLIYLALKNRAYFDECLSSGVLEEHFHVGAKSVLEKAAAKYRQSPEKFDSLVGLLTSFVDTPDVLIVRPDERLRNGGVVSSLKLTSETTNVSEDSDELRIREGQLLQDCIRRIRSDSLKHKAEQLALEIKKSPTPEKMEQYSQLIRERKALQVIESN